MKLRVLGSVSPYQKGKYNCPGYLIERNNKKYLLDCGSGITKELDLPKDLNNLTIIISHLHRDHYSDLLTLGYASYVYQRLGILKDKIKVYIPNEECLDKTYLENMEEHFFDFIFYDEKTVIEEAVKISFNKNPHPVSTFSIKIEGKDKKIVYSSDTGYKKNTLEEFSKDVDLLICETTFLENQKGQIDNHLTTKEAALIATNAKVKRLMITHTWPEIDKKIYLKETKKVFKNTIIAEEGKVLKLGSR